MKTKIQGIYKIRNCINGKIYIGQSIDIENRFEYHKKYGANYYNKHPLYNAIRKYGIEAFEFIIIEEVISVNKLDEREQYWMDHYKSYDRDYGYNLRPKAESNRGFICSEEHKEKVRQKVTERWKDPKYKQAYIDKRKGYKHTEESKLKMSLSRKGRKGNKGTWVKGHSTWNKGKKHSEESKQKMSLSKLEKCKNPEYINKMSLAQKGKKLSDEHKLKISQGLLNSKCNLSEIHKGQKAWNKGRSLKRNRLTIEDIQKFRQSNIIQFKQAL